MAMTSLLVQANGRRTLRLELFLLLMLLALLLKEKEREREGISQLIVSLPAGLLPKL